MEIPVYLFTGFLESGKTTFIQDILEGSDFNAGERTLLLMCEQGEVELDESKFFTKDNIFCEYIESLDELNPEHLSELQKKHRVERVVVEYNGMWMMQDLFRNMPTEWIISQEVTFADASVFINHNENMRQLVFDKLKTADLVVFNRCVHGFDKLEFHKIVRVANRKSQIVYEYGPDDVEPDTIVDELPFDMNAEIIEIEEDCFAEWYRDVNDNPEKYDKKKVRVLGRFATGGGLPKDNLVFGRHVMTCCADDIQFAGLLCVWKNASKIKNGSWAEIVAEVRLEYTDIYGEEGPILYCNKVVASLPPEQEVATF